MRTKGWTVVLLLLSDFVNHAWQEFGVPVGGQAKMRLLQECFQRSRSITQVGTLTHVSVVG